MPKQKKLMIWFGLLGLTVALVLFTYIELTNYRTLNPALRAAAIIFCPASLLSFLFLDVEPHTFEEAAGWLVIGLINGALYALVGAILGKYLWELDRPSV